MHVCVTFCVYLPVRVFHWAFPKASLSVAHAVWARPYLPPSLPPSQGYFSCSPLPPLQQALSILSRISPGKGYAVVMV